MEGVGVCGRQEGNGDEAAEDQDDKAGGVEGEGSLKAEAAGEALAVELKAPGYRDVELVGHGGCYCGPEPEARS